MKKNYSVTKRDIDKILEGASIRQVLSGGVSVNEDDKKPGVLSKIVKDLEEYLDKALADTDRYGRSWDIVSDPSENWIRVSDGNSDHTYTISVTPYYKLSLSEQLAGEIAKDGGDERDYDLSRFMDNAALAIIDDFK